MCEMRCAECGFEEGVEYFEPYTEQREAEQPSRLCAKCFVEDFLSNQRYFRDFHSPYRHRVPSRRHYFAARLIRFIANANEKLTRYAAEQFESSGLPFSIKFNLRNLDYETTHLDGSQQKTQKHDLTPKFTLFMREIQKSLALSTALP